MVSIILVNYNGAEFLTSCLDSINNQTYKEFDILLVDNASTDGSVSLIRSKFPRVRIIELARNLGFAEACNIGLRHSCGDFLAFLNTDTEVSPDWLRGLLSALDNFPDAAVSVPKICFYDHPNIIDSVGATYNSIGHCYSRGFREVDRGQYSKEEFIPAATACSMLIRRSVFDKTYLFEPYYFMYYEEFDFSIRIRRLGYKIVYCPGAIVYHRVSASVREISRDPLLFKQFYGNRNRLEILCKHYPLRIIFRNLPLIVLSYVFWDLYFLFKNPRLFLSFICVQPAAVFLGTLRRLNLPKSMSGAWISDIEEIYPSTLLRKGLQTLWS